MEDYEPRCIEPHWSDDRRFESEEHYNRVQAGLETIGPQDATEDDLRKDAEFRSLMSDDGGSEPLSWPDVWRDGRHGKGHEL